MTDRQNRLRSYSLFTFVQLDRSCEKVGSAETLSPLFENPDSPKDISFSLLPTKLIKFMIRVSFAVSKHEIFVRVILAVEPFLDHVSSK
jgi:hypothetical protein